MKTNETSKVKTMTPEEYEEIFDALEALGSIDDLGKIAIHTATAYKVYAATLDPENWDNSQLANESLAEGIVIQLLWELDKIAKNHGGDVRLP